MGEGNAEGRTSEGVRNVRAMLKAIAVASLFSTILFASGQDDLANFAPNQTLSRSRPCSESENGNRQGRNGRKVVLEN